MITVHLNQDEPGTIEFVVVDEFCHYAAYFGLKEWSNFKDAVNNFNTKTFAVIDAKDTGISISIDRQFGDYVTLHFDAPKIMTLIGLTRAEWKKFKIDVNSFKVKE